MWCFFLCMYSPTYEPYFLPHTSHANGCGPSSPLRGRPLGRFGPVLAFTFLAVPLAEAALGGRPRRFVTALTLGLAFGLAFLGFPAERAGMMTRRFG